MDQGLFGKYKDVIIQRENFYKEISVYIQQETGILLTEQELVIEKKKIKFHTSSVKKVVLRKKSVEEFLTQKGYIIMW